MIRVVYNVDYFFIGTWSHFLYDEMNGTETGWYQSFKFKTRFWMRLLLCLLEIWNIQFMPLSASVGNCNNDDCQTFPWLNWIYAQFEFKQCILFSLDLDDGSVRSATGHGPNNWDRSVASWRYKTSFSINLSLIYILCSVSSSTKARVPVAMILAQFANSSPGYDP